MTSEPSQTGRLVSHETRWIWPIAVLMAVALGAVGMLLAGQLGDGWHWGKSGTETTSGLGTEVLVMRTPGGLLEVARIQANEQFDKKFVYTVVGLNVGETVAHIRVPATYRYHIELAPKWDVYRKGDVFKVSAPSIKPSLPVALAPGADGEGRVRHVVSRAVQRG